MVALLLGWGWWGPPWDPAPQSPLFLQSISGSDWLNTVAAGDITGELLAAVLPDLAVNPLNVKRSSDRRFVRSCRVRRGLSATRVGLGRVGPGFPRHWKSVLSRPRGVCCTTCTCVVCHVCVMPFLPGQGLRGGSSLGPGVGTFGVGTFGVRLTPGAALALFVPCPYGDSPFLSPAPDLPCSKAGQDPRGAWPRLVRGGPYL